MFDLANVIHGCAKGLNGNNSSLAIVFFPFCVTAHYSFFGLCGSEKVISLCITEMAVLGTFILFYVAEFRPKLLLVKKKKKKTCNRSKFVSPSPNEVKVNESTGAALFCDL